MVGHGNVVERELYTTSTKNISGPYRLGVASYFSVGKAVDSLYVRVNTVEASSSIQKFVRVSISILSTTTSRGPS